MSRQPPPFMPDVQTMLMEVMESPDIALCLGLALDRLNQYEAVAKRQNKRIWDAQRRASKAMDRLHQMHERRKTTLGRVLHYRRASTEMLHWFSISNAEAHFYLITWDTVRKLIETLRDIGGFDTPTRILKIHQVRFNQYKAARDHLEHWDERIPGEKKSKWEVSESEKIKSFRGNMGRVRIEGHFTFSNDDGSDAAVDISAQSAESLEGICRQLREGITNEVKVLFESKKTIPDRRPKPVAHNTPVSPTDRARPFSHVVHTVKRPPSGKSDKAKG